MSWLEETNDDKEEFFRLSEYLISIYLKNADPEKCYLFMGYDS